MLRRRRRRRGARRGVLALAVHSDMMLFLHHRAALLLVLAILCLGVVEVDSRRTRRKKQRGSRAHRSPSLGELGPIVDKLMRDRAPPGEWYASLVEGRQGFTPQQAEALTQRLDNNVQGLQLVRSAGAPSPVGLLYGTTWRALVDGDARAAAFGRYLVEAGASAVNTERGDDPQHQGSSPLKMAMVHGPDSDLLDAMLTVGGYRDFRAEVLFFYSTSVWITGLSKELLARGGLAQRSQRSPGMQWTSHHHWIPSMEFPLTLWTSRSPMLSELLARYAAVPPAPLPNNGSHVVAAEVKVAVEEWMLPLIEAMIDACKRGVSLCDLAENGGIAGHWFQKGVLNGPDTGLAHSFAAEGYSRLFNLLRPADRDKIDGLGFTPAQIAAFRGFFNFPGARDAARRLGIDEKPFRYNRVVSKATQGATVATQDAANSGGWDPRRADIVGLLRDAGLVDFRTDVVEIDAYDTISQNEFMLHHVAQSRPLLLTSGATNDWPWRTTWQKDTFMENFDDHAEFLIGKIPCACTFTLNSLPAYGRLFICSVKLTCYCGAHADAEALGRRDSFAELKTVSAFRRHVSFPVASSCTADADGAALAPCDVDIPAPPDAPLYIFNRKAVPADVMQAADMKRQWLREENMEFLMDYREPEFANPGAQDVDAGPGRLRPKHTQFYMGPVCQWSL
jgi:hypothetical protein